MEAPVFHILLVADRQSTVQILLDKCLELEHRPVFISDQISEINEALMFEPVDIVLLQQDSFEATSKAELIRFTHELPLVWVLNPSTSLAILPNLIQSSPQGFVDANIGLPALQGTLCTAFEYGALKIPDSDTVVSDDLVLADEIKSKHSFFNDCMFLPVDDQLIKLNYSDIFYVKSDNVYVEIYTRSQTYLLRSSLTNFLAKMPSSIFFRTHKSYGVNIHHVDAVNHIDPVIRDTKIPISKSFKQFLLDATK
ncbi:MAG: LytR/AlgR family response regulator transcription factor [Flavobacteriaceae bacterium]